jgi:hypothetical protein
LPVLEVEETAFSPIIIKTPYKKGRFLVFHRLFLQFLKQRETARIQSNVHERAFLFAILHRIVAAVENNKKKYTA